jgi:ABC-type tungstate transport system substrate-binding protein
VDLVGDGLAQALRLIFSLDPEVLGITLLSLQVSLASTAVTPDPGAA